MKRIVTTSTMIMTCAGLSLGLTAGGCKKQPPAPVPAQTPPKVSTPPPATPTNADSPPTLTTPATIPAPSPMPARTSGVSPTTSPSTMPTTQPLIGSATMPDAPLRPDMVPPANDKVATFLGLSGPKPATWIWHPLSQGSMSVVEYMVPGVDGGDQAKVAVIPAGGTLDANILRWKGQFRDTEGNVGAVDPQVETFEVDGMPVTLVEIAGEYRGMGMTNYAPDQLFLTAILEPEGMSNQIFVRFVGPRKTVEANRAAFVALIKGLKPVEAEK